MISFELNDTSLTCILSGRMDSTSCQEIDSQLEEQYTKSPNAEITFDLEKVDYVASSFLRLCMKAGKKMAEGKLTIINVDPHVKKVFMISGFDKLMDIK